MEIGNDFSKLDAQDEMSAFAKFTPEEHAEYQNYLDQFAMARDTAGEPVPDHVDGSGS